MPNTYLLIRAYRKEDAYTCAFVISLFSFSFSNNEDKGTIEDFFFYLPEILPCRCIWLFRWYLWLLWRIPNTVRKGKCVYLWLFWWFVSGRPLESCKNKKKSKHSVEVSGFFYHSDFTWNQFGDARCYRNVKYAILTHLEALNFDLHDFFGTFWRLKFTKVTNFRASKMAKMAFLELLDSLKLISRKI